MTRSRRIVPAAVLIVCALTAIPATRAAGADGQAKHNGRYATRISMEMGRLRINDRAAFANGVSPDSWSWLRMSGGVQVLQRYFVDAGFGLLSLKDRRRFSQDVTGGFGGDIPRTEKSGVSGGEVFVAAGVRQQLLPFLGAEGMLGATAMSASRGIDRCEDCDKEKLALKGGRFVQMNLLFGKRVADVSRESGAGPFLGYRCFFSGDMESMVMLGMAARFNY
jgi:hypothetical protein